MSFQIAFTLGGYPAVWGCSASGSTLSPPSGAFAWIHPFRPGQAVRVCPAWEMRWWVPSASGGPALPGATVTLTPLRDMWPSERAFQGMSDLCSLLLPRGALWGLTPLLSSQGALHGRPLSSKAPGSILRVSPGGASTCGSMTSSWTRGVLAVSSLGAGSGISSSEVILVNETLEVP